MTGLAWIGDAAGVGELTDRARVSVWDRGLMVGFGLFETMRVVAGAVPLWERHLARMAASAEVFGLPAPPRERLRAAAGELLAAVGGGEGVLRLMVTGGGGWGGGDGGAAPVFVLTTRASGSSDRPVRLAMVAAHRGAGDPTVAHKTTSRAFWVLAQRRAAALGGDEALVRDAAGEVLESTNGNVLVLVDSVWCTPPADGRILPGIARAVLIEGLRAAGRRVVEQPVDALALARAEQVVVTNAVHGPRRAVVVAPGAPVGSDAGAELGELRRLWAAALGA